ncbi:MAG TPA: hypothetical protein ENK43_08375 [Planctomycetes bacterium]|nr:hypothetical protein [Planctomycetota bacterium]
MIPRIPTLRTTLVVCLLLVLSGIGFSQSTLEIKFRDGERIRLRDGKLKDLGGAGLGGIAAPIRALEAAGATWRRPFSLSESAIENLVDVARQRMPNGSYDLNLVFELHLPPSVDVSATLESLRGSPVIESATLQPEAPRGSVAPDLSSLQSWVGPAGLGSGIQTNWTAPGGRGAGVKALIVDVGWLPAHVDAPPTTFLGAPYDVNNPAYDPHHGTADLALLGAPNDGVGITGVISDATFYLGAASTTTNLFNIANVITLALSNGFGPGDIIALPLEVSYVGSALPIELHGPTRAAIDMATAQGVIVVTAAGNGSVDLSSAPVPGNFAMDSIMAGAGGMPLGSGERQRVPISNWGPPVDVQAQGELVVTAGYGLLYMGVGTQEYYTHLFAGTSAAAMITAGVCGQLQGLLAASGQPPLSPALMRQALVATGSPQITAPGAPVQHIGPRVDAASAYGLLLGASAVISQITPARLSIGVASESLTVQGLGFTASSVVTWNGIPLATTLGTPTQLSAVVPGSLLASSQVVSVAVDNGGGIVSPALPVTVDGPFLGASGQGAGVLRVNGSMGLPDHRVDVSLNTAFSIDVAPISPLFTNTPFAVFGFIGVPNLQDGYSITGISGSMAFAPCPADPLNPNLFTFATTVPLGGCQPAFMASGNPWNVVLGGVPTPLRFTLQGVTVIGTTAIFTNGIIVDVH